MGLLRKTSRNGSVGTFLVLGLLVVLFAGVVFAQRGGNPFDELWNAIHALQGNVTQLFATTASLQSQVNDVNNHLLGFEAQINQNISALQSADAGLQTQIITVNTDLQDFKSQTNQSISDLHATDQNLQEQILGIGGIGINSSEELPTCDETIVGKLWIKDVNEANSLHFCKRIPHQDGTLFVQNSILPSPRSGHSCAYSSNKIYCFGGYNESYLNQIVSYDYDLDQLTVSPAVLPTASAMLSCVTALSGSIYCFSAYPTSGQVIQFDPSTNAVNVVATSGALTAQTRCALDSSTDKIYCFGGDTGTGGVRSIVEFNVNTGGVTTMSAQLPEGRMGLSCAEFTATHKIYCFGGYSNQILEYDPAIDSLTVLPFTLPMPLGYSNCNMSAALNKIYCAGGRNEFSAVNAIIEFDPITGAVNAINDVYSPARFYDSCAMNSIGNQIFCFGGFVPGQAIYLDQITKFEINSTITYLWVKLA